MATLRPAIPPDGQAPDSLPTLMLQPTALTAKGVSGTGQGYVYVKNYGGTQINQNITSSNNYNSMTITFTTGATSTSATIGANCTATRIQLDDFVLNPS